MTENALEGATAKTERDGQQSSYEHYSVLNGGRQSTIYRTVFFHRGQMVTSGDAESDTSTCF